MVEGAVHIPVRRGIAVDPQALIEEARRKARRRRIRNGAVVLFAVGVGVAAFLGSKGQGGGGGGAAQASGGQGAAASLVSASVPYLPTRVAVRDIAFDARAPDTVYVATLGNKPMGRVYKSTDDGGHWRLMLRSRRAVLTLAADPQHPGTLYVGTEGGIFKTLDGGTTWRALIRWRLATGPYRLTVDPTDSRIVYESSGSGLSRSTDGGHHWKFLSWNAALAGSRWAVAPTIAFAPSNPEIVYALWEYQDPLLIASKDSGKTWDGPGPLHIDPGVNHSDRGPVLVVDSQRPKTLYAALGDAVLKSTDAGQSWRSIANDLPLFRGIGVNALAVDPRHTGTVYASIPSEGIFKTTDGGRTWSPSPTLVPAFSVQILAINPAQPSTIYAVGRTPLGSQIARSTDGGHTWVTIG